MKRNNLKGVCLALAQVQEQPLQLDFSDLANAGITVLLRVGYGYAPSWEAVEILDWLGSIDGYVQVDGYAYLI